MKKIIFVLFLFSSFSLSAQLWCTPGSRWHHNYSFFATMGYAILTYEKDTIYEGKNCQKITEHLHRVDQSTWTTYDSYKNWFAYDSAEVIFLYDDWISDWDTMFNFSSIPGERWEMIKSDPENFTNVIDTGSIMIQGEFIYWLYVSYTSPFLPTTYDTIYERIGPRRNFPYTSSVMSTDGEYGGVCSFTDTTINQFPYSDVTCENMPDAVNEFSEINDLNIYPNPTYGTINFSFPENLSVKYTITDITGRICITKSKIQNNSVSLEKLNNGIYFILLEWDNNKIVKKIKLIK